METTLIVKMFAMILGVMFLLPTTVTPTTAAVSASDLAQAAFYRQNRQFITIEITKLDNSKVEIDAPFMALQLEQGTKATLLVPQSQC